jgi:hypothetical protein
MSDIPIRAHDDETRIFQQALAGFDTPAYVRRARRVQGALDTLLAGCNKRREEWLLMSRIHLAVLHAQAGRWEVLRPLLADPGQEEVLGRLHDELRPELVVPVRQTDSPRTHLRTLCKLCASLERFNEQWLAHVEKVDPTEVNRLREGYNRYYLLEKECALRCGSAVARRGFEPLPPLSRAELLSLLPPLPVPALAEK